MSEIDVLLNELRNMKDSERQNHIANNKETWNKINKKEWKDLGFTSEEEVKDWINANPYCNL